MWKGIKAVSGGLLRQARGIDFQLPVIYMRAGKGFCCWKETSGSRNLLKYEVERNETSH
ncbi:MAG: hypothetical protein HFG56_07270 [Lachnospiraceae bacterium]|nr:hypothetical protein [Lachnospiraceae bacterium]